MERIGHDWRDSWKDARADSWKRITAELLEFSLVVVLLVAIAATAAGVGSLFLDEDPDAPKAPVMEFSSVGGEMKGDGIECGPGQVDSQVK